MKTGWVSHRFQHDCTVLAAYILCVLPAASRHGTVFTAHQGTKALNIHRREAFSHAVWFDFSCAHRPSRGCVRLRPILLLR